MRLNLQETIFFKPYSWTQILYFYAYYEYGWTLNILWIEIFLKIKTFIKTINHN